jgi:hypothetical protein
LWYAAWDLAFHTLPLSIVDTEFAKHQMALMFDRVYLHPSGQIPGYEWNLSDMNPSVHAWAMLFLHRAEMALKGEADLVLSRPLRCSMQRSYPGSNSGQLLIGHRSLQRRHDVPPLVHDFPKFTIVREHGIAGQLWTDPTFRPGAVTDHTTGLVKFLTALGTPRRIFRSQPARTLLVGDLAISVARPSGI